MVTEYAYFQCKTAAVNRDTGYVGRISRDFSADTFKKILENRLSGI